MSETIKSHVLSLTDNVPTHMITLTLCPEDKIDDVKKWNNRICNEYSTHTNKIANMLKRYLGLRNRNPKILVTRETHDKYGEIKPVHYHGLLYLPDEDIVKVDSKASTVKQILCNKFRQDFKYCEVDFRKVNDDKCVTSYVLKDIDNHVDCLFVS